MAEKDWIDNESCTKPEMCMCASCGCVGYGYVPVQEMKCTYELDQAIMSGTVFPELDLDICEYGCICKCKGGVENE